MAEVWAARDLELDRPVALKLLGPEADPARFQREAYAAAALSHPNVTQLFDYGAWEGRPYMVLELLPGGTLEDRLRDGRALPDAETERIAREVAAGLAHAHSRGLVHRDLKPANVLFDADGRAKIADFGIARMGGAGTLTEAGTMLGTAAYISPEQAAGEPATAASDVYSFGVILFRMLTGRLPFEAKEPLDLVAMHRNVPPPPVATLRRDAPTQLARIADAALAKNPHARPPDGSALTAAHGRRRPRPDPPRRAERPPGRPRSRPPPRRPSRRSPPRPPPWGRRRTRCRSRRLAGPCSRSSSRSGTRSARSPFSTTSWPPRSTRSARPGRRSSSTTGRRTGPSRP